MKTIKKTHESHIKSYENHVKSIIPGILGENGTFATFGTTEDFWKFMKTEKNGIFGKFGGTQKLWQDMLSRNPEKIRHSQISASRRIPGNS